MKNILILILLFSFISVDAQRQTKKYNSLQDRYEYYNARGQMTGYEVYNSLQEQWEYYSVKTSRSSNKYGEPQSTFDADLAIFALSTAEKNRANKMDNHNRFKNTIERIKNHIDNIENNEVRNNVIEAYNKKVANLNKADYNQMLQSTQATTNRINYNIETYNRLYNQAINNYKAKVRDSKTVNYTTFISSTMSRLRNKPNVNGSVIYEPTKGERVDVLQKITDNYYKVKINGYYGYIAKSYID